VSCEEAIGWKWVVVNGWLMGGCGWRESLRWDRGRRVFKVGWLGLMYVVEVVAVVFVVVDDGDGVADCSMRIEASR
jgi:hypothetical protein